MNNININSKVKSLHTMLVLFGSILVIFAIRWQIVESDKYIQAAESRIYSSELTSLRGSIYSADGTTLAYSEPRYHVYYDLREIEFAEQFNFQSRQEFVDLVAPLINKTPEEFKRLIQENSEKGYIWVKIEDAITVEDHEKLNSLASPSSGRKLQGIRFEYTSKRIYPEGSLASHIIGLTNSSQNTFMGVGGIEEAMNGILSPTEGLIIKENDARGKAIASSLIATIEPKRGKSIYTSIDKKLQTIVEEQVKISVEQFNAESGTIIITDPKNGEIMAFANFPTYDANLREQKNPEVYTNAAVTSPYEMGSIAKSLTMAAAIDLGKISSDSIILPDGHNGCEEFSAELPPLCTWDKKPQPGPMSAERCLVLSDNICFYEMAQLMSADEFYSYLVKFGVGKSTNIDIAGESISYLREPEKWINEDFAAFSYGHGYLVNSVQIISSIGAIANNGIRMQPHFVTNIVDEKTGVERPQNPTILDKVIEPESANQLTKSMYEVYKSNFRDYEYYYSDLQNYYIGMKSGSALIANQFGYTDQLNNLYLGFDASPDRTFVMLVHLKKPEGGLSFYNTRVMWFDTFSKIKDHLQVPRIGSW